MDHGICSGVWAPCGRRCEIFHDHILLYDVAVPCESLYLPVPRMGIRPDCGLDRYGGRLEPAVHSLYNSVQIRKMAESSFDRRKRNRKFATRFRHLLAVKRKAHMQESR